MTSNAVVHAAYKSLLSIKAIQLTHLLHRVKKRSKNRGLQGQSKLTVKIREEKGPGMVKTAKEVLFTSNLNNTTG